MFLRHSKVLEHPGEEQRSVLLSYFIVMIFLVSEGAFVMFQPVLTPGLAAAVSNSCPNHNVFCCGCLSRHVPQAALALFMAPIVVSRRMQGITTAPETRVIWCGIPQAQKDSLVFMCAWGHKGLQVPAWQSCQMRGTEMEHGCRALWFV